MSREKDKIRAAFRAACFSRDRYRCAICEIPESQVEKLDAHHITDRNEMPNGGYVPENGISLCPECHEKAEVYHQTGGWDWAEGFHPNSLYFLIGCSPEEAVLASEKLSRKTR